MTKRGILLIEHGSRNGKSREVLEATACIIREKSGIPVYPCFLEFDEPGIEDALISLAEEADEITAVPMLLAEGIHSKETIPNRLKAAAEQLSEKNRTIHLRYAEPLGADPALADILLRKADAAKDLD